MTTYTLNDAELTCLGLCVHCHVRCDGDLAEPHAANCPMATGLGTARGDQMIDGERCSGACRRLLESGEPYTTRNDGAWCLGCAATEHAA